MVSPIYETTETNKQGITNPTFPSGAKNSTLDSGAVNGMEAEHITIDDAMPAQAAPKNPCAEWSSGPDNNVYLQGK